MCLPIGEGRRPSVASPSLRQGLARHAGQCVLQSHHIAPWVQRAIHTPNRHVMGRETANRQVSSVEMNAPGVGAGESLNRRRGEEGN